MPLGTYNKEKKLFRVKREYDWERMSIRKDRIIFYVAFVIIIA